MSAATRKGSTQLRETVETVVSCDSIEGVPFGREVQAAEPPPPGGGRADGGASFRRLRCFENFTRESIADFRPCRFWSIPLMDTAKGYFKMDIP